MSSMSEPQSSEPQYPLYYARVDVAGRLGPGAFEALQKAGGIYAAHLATPLLVQTPPLHIVSPLDDVDGEPLPNAHLKVPPRFAEFAQRVEDAVLAASLANKEAWFRRPLGDDALRASLKRFASVDTLKVRVPRDLLVFDAQGTLVPRDAVSTAADVSVRCLLELSRVCFGRTEFGAMWTLAQVQILPPPPPPPSPPRCLIDATAVSDESDDEAGEEEGTDVGSEEGGGGQEWVEEFS